MLAAGEMLWRRKHVPNHGSGDDARASCTLDNTAAHDVRLTTVFVRRNLNAAEP